MPDTRFRTAIGSLRSAVAGVKAIILIGPDGVVSDYLAVDPAFDIAMFVAEYTTLLRIACRTSEDTGSGELREHICISERTIVFARSVLAGFYLVLISNTQAPVGRVRYELKVAARHLERAMDKFSG